MSSSIDYQIEPDLDAESFIDVLRRSTLAERRPVKDRDRMETMLRGANLIATARHEGRLVGVARALTDFSFCTYLSDLAVDEAYQKRGIGKALLNQIREASGPDVTTLILLAAPKAVDYYPHIGLTCHDSCWTIPAGTKPTT